MKIVIDVPENEVPKRREIVEIGLQFMDGEVCECTYPFQVLPKGHGRLIDADEYKEHLYACETNGRPLHRMELDERLATVDNAPTIIEADKGEEEC